MERRDFSRGPAWIALVLAVLALALTFYRAPSAATGEQPTSSQASAAGLLDRIDEVGELHAGYGVYPPYTEEDPNTGDVSGFSIELVEHVAAEINATVRWHRLNWNTMSADLKRGTYDVIADPIFQTIPRAREFAFTAPYAYFADGIAVVPLDEDRFQRLQDLDQPGVRVAVGQGWASESLLRARFQEADVVAVQTTTDLLAVFNEVVAGRADAAVADAADAKRFVSEHADQVKALFLDDPPAYMPAGFALRPDDTAGAEFLTVALRNLRATGVLDTLAERYGVTTRLDHRED